MRKRKRKMKKVMPPATRLIVYANIIFKSQRVSIFTTHIHKPRYGYNRVIANSLSILLLYYLLFIITSRVLRWLINDS